LTRWPLRIDEWASLSCSAGSEGRASLAFCGQALRSHRKSTIRGKAETVIVRSERLDNNEMQRTKPGLVGASPLISVFGGPTALARP
jgi:hypothetical protein